MENLVNSNSNKNQKKSSFIKVDMTPMVDLGFLLITFFMFTTNFSKPTTMDFSYPSNNEETRNEIGDKNQLTLILEKNNKVYYHQSSEGNLSSNNLFSTTLESEKLLKIIDNAKKNATKKEIFTVIIKPSENANYKNFVEVLDQMSISNTEHYGIAKIKYWEQKIIDQKE